jgi:hypothetical protein
MSKEHKYYYNLNFKKVNNLNKKTSDFKKSRISIKNKNNNKEQIRPPP